jgi:hypothetical protein
VPRANRYTVTIRAGPRVERRRFDALGPALDALEQSMRALSQTERRDPVDLRYREFEPVTQVAARGELAGPRRLRAGIDLRGDGSAEAFTGRVRRRLVEQRSGESPYDALRRVVGGGGERAPGGRQRTSAGP